MDGRLGRGRGGRVVRLWRWGGIVFAVAGLLIATGASARTAELELNNQELLEQVGKALDVTTEALSPVFAEKPALFEHLKDTAAAVRMVDLVFAAKDTEALAELAAWRVNRSLEAFLDKALPAPVLSALTVFRTYHASLELLRDVLVIPAFDEKLYARFKQQRQEGGASAEDAFTEATVAGGSGYYLVKPAMLEKYYKAKGWNKDAVGDKLAAAAAGQIDQFWQKRLEARYQQELVQAQAKEVTARPWAARDNELAALRAALALAGANGPFFTRPDLAQFTGWHFSLYTRYPPDRPDPFVPARQGSDANNPVSQTFYLQKDGFLEKRDDNGYPYECDSSGKRLLTGTARVLLMLHVWPRLYQSAQGGKPFSYDQIETIKTMPASLKPQMTLIREVTNDAFALGHVYRKNNDKVESTYWFDGVSATHRIQLGVSYTQPQSGTRLTLDSALLDKMLQIVAEKERASAAKPVKSGK